MTTRVAVSVDVDSVATHLVRYGVPDCPDAHSAYDIAIPRALELFSNSNVRATFFLVAGEAQQKPEIVRAIRDHGHEIACHTMSHDVGCDLDNPAVVEREIVESKLVLEELSSSPVSGFRAPGWCYSVPLLQALADAGYRYDASLFPSWMLFASLVALRKRGVPADRNQGFQPFRCAFSPATPFLPKATPSLVEIPLATVPLLRFPYYHTMHYLLPPSVFRAIRWMTLRTRSNVTYTLHAVDFLGLREDGLDERIAVHPGLPLSLSSKLEQIRSELRLLSAQCSFATMAELATHSQGGRSFA